MLRAVAPEVPLEKLPDGSFNEGGETGETRATLIVAGMKKPERPGEKEQQGDRPQEPVDYATPAFVRRNIVIEAPRTTPRRQPGGTAQA